MMFDPAHLQTSIDAVLKQADAPPDHTKAFIVTGTTEDGGGVTAVYVEKVGRGWQVGGEFAYTHDAGARAGVGAIWTGK